MVRFYVPRAPVLGQRSSPMSGSAARPGHASGAWSLEEAPAERPGGAGGVSSRALRGTPPVSGVNRSHQHFWPAHTSVTATSQLIDETPFRGDRSTPCAAHLLRDRGQTPVMPRLQPITSSSALLKHPKSQHSVPGTQPRSHTQTSPTRRREKNREKVKTRTQAMAPAAQRQEIPGQRSPRQPTPERGRRAHADSPGPASVVGKSSTSCSVA